MTSKKGDVETKIVSVVDPSDDYNQESELDRAKLKKAFRFASWCSISLVSTFELELPQLLANVMSTSSLYLYYSSPYLSLARREYTTSET